MMLLHGKTKVTKVDYSWLTTAIFDVLAQCRARQQLAIFHLCQDQPYMEKDIPAHAVLSGLISQLLDAVLTAKLPLLRAESRSLDLQARFSDPAWRAHAPRIPFAVLHELLDLFPAVHILVDRVDRIRGDAEAFMRPLASLVQESKARVKIFLVASSNGYDRPGGKMSEELMESIADDLGSARFWCLEQNQ